MAQEEAIGGSCKKLYTGGPQLTGSYFSRKPFEPGTPPHVVKAYEEAEREQLLRLVLKKRTGVGEPIDLASIEGEVDDYRNPCDAGLPLPFLTAGVQQDYVHSGKSSHHPQICKGQELAHRPQAIGTLVYGLTHWTCLTCRRFKGASGSRHCPGCRANML